MSTRYKEIREILRQAPEYCSSVDCKATNRYVFSLYDKNPLPEETMTKLNKVGAKICNCAPRVKCLY